MRVFLAFPVPEAVRTYASALQQRLRASGVRGKWTNAASMHLTALFLGEQSEEGVSQLAAEIEQHVRSLPPLKLALQGAGCFGRPPRVLFLRWESVEDEVFGRAVDMTRRCAWEAGVVVEPATLRKEPVAHLTLLRFRGSRESKSLRPVAGLRGNRLEWRTTVPEPPDSVRNLGLASLVLFRSTLRPEGPIYDALHTFPLRGEGDET